MHKKINHIPTSASHSVLRKAPIEQIRKLFSTLQADHPLVAIVGDPASGKTELSKQYAKEYKGDYHHIWFVQVENWKKTYQNLAQELKLFSEKELANIGGIEKVDIDLLIAKVHRAFGYSDRKKSLIIFDNAPEGFVENQLKEQLPIRTDIIITSRSSNWEPKVNLSSEKNCLLTLKEGVQLLRSWIEEERFDSAEAEKIIRRFNYSPVPIAQAGSN